MILSFLILLVLQMLTPYWWWIFAVPLLYGFFRGKSGRQSLLAGLVSAGLLWLVAALYHFLGDAALVAPRVAQMLGLAAPEGLVAISALIGMVCGGCAGLTGFLVRDLFRKTPH